MPRKSCKASRRCWLTGQRWSSKRSNRSEKRMRKTPLPLIIVLSLIVRPWPSGAQQGRYLYKATLVQAAPGKILEVIDLFQTISNEMKQAGTQAPLCMRHSQGDRWDLLLLFPMGSYGDYYGREKVGRRDTNEPLSVPAEKLKQDVTWQEDDL